MTRLANDLDDLAADVGDLRDTFTRIATEVAAEIASRVPVQSGRAKASVRGHRTGSKAFVRAGTGAVNYLGPLNYGWPQRGIEPVEFMQKGEQAYMPRAIDRINEEIENAITKRGLR